MKRLIALLVVMICIPSFAFASGNVPGDYSAYGVIQAGSMLSSVWMREHASGTEMSSLPDGLSVIGEEAFAGTAIASIQLPDTLQVIGRRAFADILEMVYVYITEGTQFIDQSAFAGNGDLTIAGQQGSYAEQWARENGYRFIYGEALLTDGFLRLLRNSDCRKQLVAPLLLFALALMLAAMNKRRPNVRRTGEGKSMRPQERAELHAIAYRFP